MLPNIKKLLLIFTFIFTSLNAFAENEFKIITLQHRFASDILPIIRPLVGDYGTATGTDNYLFLRASPERMRDIEATIAQIDIARINRKITVNTSSNNQTQRESISTSGEVKIGRVIIGNNQRELPNNGQVNIENNQRDSKQAANQFLNVLDGQQAFIKVGQIVPFTQDWVTITRRYVQINKTTDWREITTGFAVRVRTIGGSTGKTVINTVELEITPRITKLNSQGNIDFEA